MIHLQPPENFSPRFEVVSCFVEVKGRILLLHRQDGKPEGNKWGVPAGKKEGQEEAKKALVREVEEETGMRIPPEQLTFVDTVYVRYPDYDFTFSTFHVVFEVEPQIFLNNENKAFRWVRPKEALAMELVRDEDERIRVFYRV